MRPFAPTLALTSVFACSPVIENAPFPARPDGVRPGDLMGPYDGIVVDAETDRPVAGAVVAGSWAFERGVGLSGPAGAREIVVETGPDGRYALPRLDDSPSGARLRRFTLVVYHRGHVGWRSDRRFRDLGLRRDFAQRGNRVRLEPWAASDRHVLHLAFLGGGERLHTAATWERERAVAELEGRSAELEKPTPAPAGPSAGLFDVSGLLTEDEVRGVTGYVGAFQIGRLEDLPTTEFYDSRHFRAEGKPEGFDVALRVWRLGAAGSEAQFRRLLSELPGAVATEEIGDRSLRARSGDVFGLAFLARGQGTVVSITCGLAQCPEPALLLRLAKLVEGKLTTLPALDQDAEP